MRINWPRVDSRGQLRVEARSRRESVQVGWNLPGSTFIHHHVTMVLGEFYGAEAHTFTDFLCMFPKCSFLNTTFILRRLRPPFHIGPVNLIFLRARRHVPTPPDLANTRQFFHILTTLQFQPGQTVSTASTKSAFFLQIQNVFFRRRRAFGQDQWPWYVPSCSNSSSSFSELALDDLVFTRIHPQIPSPRLYIPFPLRILIAN